MASGGSSERPYPVLTDTHTRPRERARRSRGEHSTRDRKTKMAKAKAAKPTVPTDERELAWAITEALAEIPMPLAVPPEDRPEFAQMLAAQILKGQGE